MDYEHLDPSGSLMEVCIYFFRFVDGVGFA